MKIYTNRKKFELSGENSLTGCSQRPIYLFSVHYLIWELSLCFEVFRVKIFFVFSLEYVFIVYDYLLFILNVYCILLHVLSCFPSAEGLFVCTLNGGCFWEICRDSHFISHPLSLSPGSYELCFYFLYR